MNRDRSLIALQASLIEAMSSNASAAPAPALLPFEAAGRLWAVRCQEVLRLAVQADVTLLQGYAGTPSCILGVLPTDTEMLSVVDAGLLLGATPVVKSLKSRLIVFGEGALKGVALLVDRVHDRVDSLNSGREDALLSAGALHSRLSQLAGAVEV